MKSETTYEVCVERDGVQSRRGVFGTTLMGPQVEFAKQYNEEEAANARAEGRGIRARFFVARVTVTCEEIK